MKAILFAVIFIVSNFATLPVSAETPVKSAPKINLNLADINELMFSMKGIGKKRAEAIVAYRKQHKKFHSVSDLALVKGIGRSFVDKHDKELNEKYSVG